MFHFLQFAATRAALAVITLIMVSFIVFSLMELVPGDCAERYLAFKNTTGAQISVADIEAERDQHEFVTFELEPGDCIVHHGLTLHHAPGNSTSRPRRALASRFCGDDVTYEPEGSFQPLIREPDLAPGAPLECELFPRVWPRTDGSPLEEDDLP